jgi:hypothetical protein
LTNKRGWVPNGKLGQRAGDCFVPPLAGLAKTVQRKKMAGDR